MKEIILEDWKAFVDHVERFHRLPYVFRGQSNKAWELEPRFLREVKGYHLSEERALAVEGLLLDRFIAEAHHHIHPNLFNTTGDAVGWWSLMQHHGAPTRLLDWSASIYVAAYFAALGSSTSDGAIWFAHVHQLSSKAEFPRAKRHQDKYLTEAGAPMEIHFVSRTYLSDRMIAQQGSFSVCRSPLHEHSAAMLQNSRSDAGDEVFLGKIIIPKEIKTSFIARLRAMNITATSLFPGLDGLGASLSEELRLLER